MKKGDEKRGLRYICDACGNVGDIGALVGWRFVYVVPVSPGERFFAGQACVCPDCIAPKKWTDEHGTVREGVLVCP
jgi:hypothetical protein